MATVSELVDCTGFSVEGPDGLVGCVEEIWLDGTGRPAGFAVRTPDGARSLLPAGAVRDVDPDTRELLVDSRDELLELDAPRLVGEGLTPAQLGRPLWQTVLLGLSGLATLIALEIALAFLAAYLATGHAY